MVDSQAWRVFDRGLVPSDERREKPTADLFSRLRRTDSLHAIAVRFARSAFGYPVSSPSTPAATISPSNQSSFSIDKSPLPPRLPLPHFPSFDFDIDGAEITPPTSSPSPRPSPAHAIPGNDKDDSTVHASSASTAALPPIELSATPSENKLPSPSCPLPTARIPTLFIPPATRFSAGSSICGAPIPLCTSTSFNSVDPGVPQYTASASSFPGWQRNSHQAVHSSRLAWH